jgi:hypothetical protein
MRFKKISAAAALLLLLFAPASGEEIRTITTEKSRLHRQVTRLPIYVVLPEGAGFAKTDNGIIDKKARISVNTAASTAAFDSLMNEFSAEGLKKRGLDLKSLHKFIWNGSRAALCKAFFTDKGKDCMGEWILLVEGKRVTWLITGIYDCRDQKASEKVLGIVKSAWIDDGRESEHGPKSDLAFCHIDTVGTPYKFAGTQQGAIVYTKDGRLPTRSPDGAVFVLSCLERTYVLPEKMLKFARDRCAAAAGRKKHTILAENQVTADGLDGIEIIARTEEERSELIYQTIFFDNDICRVMVGMTREKEIEAVEDFVNMAMSFRRVEGGAEEAKIR